MDTIVALSTPPGRSAIAVVRISGTLVPEICEGLTKKFIPERQAVLCRLRDEEDEIDQAIVIRFGHGTSYTGENLLECHVHGSSAVVKRLLATLVDRFSCRLAKPGEFTRRALSNGKLDLVQIEALSDLIDSETEQQRRQAMNALGGGLRDVVDALSEALLALRARITAHIDFSDEGDVREEDMADLRKGLASILNEIDGLLLRARRAERVREGFRVALCGLPNAGKSSLLNAMAGRDVAIVHPTPGTTRDRLDVALDLDGYPVVLYDTAGLRETSDQVEAIGVERTRQAAQEADIAIWLAPLDEPAAPPPDWAVSSWIVLTSKDDHGIETGSVSVLRNDGLEAIKAAIHAAIQRFGADNEPVVVARERQRMLLEKAQLACGRALVVSEIELVDAELQLAHGALAELVGRVGIENVLDSLFSRFCIGK